MGDVSNAAIVIHPRMYERGRECGWFLGMCGFSSQARPLIDESATPRSFVPIMDSAFVDLGECMSMVSASTRQIVSFCLSPTPRPVDKTRLGFIRSQCLSLTITSVGPNPDPQVTGLLSTLALLYNDGRARAPRHSSDPVSGLTWSLAFL